MEEFLSIAARTIDIEIDQEAQQIGGVLKGVLAKASAEGYLRSGRVLIELDRACAAAVLKRGEFVWQTIHRCITTGNVQFSNTLSSQLKAFAAPYLAGNVGGMVGRATAEATKMGMSSIALQESTTAQNHAQRRMESEIDLFCAALSVAPQGVQYQPHNVFNIHGSNVGSLQTGSSSNATVTLNSSNNNYGQVSAALDALRKEIESTESDATSLFLIEESKSELAKSEPNKSRLQSYAAAIKNCFKGAIDLAPKIPEAIEAVHRTIALLP